jgi:hypothetical protein
VSVKRTASSRGESTGSSSGSSARGGSEPALRAQSAIHRYIQVAAEKVGADLVLVDLGPNLGALNRAALATSDFFITPVAPDLFSIQGTENLGNKLVSWRREWDQCNNAWSGKLSIPLGQPKYLGYVVQMHNMRTNSIEGMTAGWAIYGQELEPAIRRNISGDAIAFGGQPAIDDLILAGYSSVIVWSVHVDWDPAIPIRCSCSASEPDIMGEALMAGRNQGNSLSASLVSGRSGIMLRRTLPGLRLLKKQLSRRSDAHGLNAAATLETGARGENSTFAMSFLT